jgi:hypothetical protein
VLILANTSTPTRTTRAAALGFDDCDHFATGSLDRDETASWTKERGAVPRDGAVWWACVFGPRNNK